MCTTLLLVLDCEPLYCYISYIVEGSHLYFFFHALSLNDFITIITVSCEKKGIQQHYLIITLFNCIYCRFRVCLRHAFKLIYSGHERKVLKDHLSRFYCKSRQAVGKSQQ